MRKKNGRRGTSMVSQLKIDKDIHVDRAWIQDYVRAIVLVCETKGVKVTSIRMCHSKRKGTHHYVDIQPAVRPELANRLQWLLGDDCLRVDYNRARIESGLVEDADWNKLFERIGQRYVTLYSGKVPAGTRKTMKGGINQID
jgi:hypothetical protein